MIRKDDLYYLIQKKKPHSNHQGSPRLRVVGTRGSQGGKCPPPRIFTELDAKLLKCHFITDCPLRFSDLPTAQPSGLDNPLALASS